MNAALPLRVLVMGPPGSGKSTLARRLGAALDLPVVHLDRLYHRPGFRPRPDTVFLPAVDAATRRPAWVIDGNHTRAIAMRLAAADLVVLLDLPRHVTLSRLIKRLLAQRGRIRPDSAPGCVERFHLGFLLFAWRWRRYERPALLAALAGAEAKTDRLRTPAEVERFAASFRPPARASGS